MNFDNYVLDAIQAEDEGVEFPIRIVDVGDAFGYTKRSDAYQFIRRNSEELIARGLLLIRRNSPPSFDESDEIDKYYLSVKGYKFTLARARTKKGAEYLLHLLEIEEMYLESLKRSLAAAVAPQEIKVISKEDDLEKRRKAFTRTLWGLYEDSQMHSYQYVMDCVRKNPYFVEGRDFKVIDNKKRDVVWAITEETYHLMMACFRGTKGVNLDNLNSEEQFIFTIGKFFQQLNLHEQQNLRMGQQGRQM